MLLRFWLLLNLVVLGFSFQTTKTALHALRLSPKRSALDLSSPLFGEDANDEERYGDSERSMKDGEDMAKLFFKEMQRRSDGSVDDSTPQEVSKDAVSPPLQSPSKEDLRKLIAGTGNADKTDDANTNDDRKSSSQSSKFTGRDSIPPQPPFSRSPREPFLSGNSNNAGPRTPREVMMEREYQLVGRAERNLGIQAVIAVIAMTFYIYIGLSGGISSRPDGPDLGADDMLPFEQLVPRQTDRENTVWL